MIRPLIAAIVLTLSAPAAHAETRPVVVELFTSQGCSTCPPADVFLAELATNPRILALGFHVDYWDRLGWKDPLSAPGSTARQHAYARWFGDNEVYTPQMVVDGKREFVGSDRKAILSAIAPEPVAATSVTFSPDRKSVAIGSGAGRGNIILARYVLERTNPVPKGENAGRTAKDVHGVTAIRTLGGWTGAAQSFDIDPPAANEGVAILVQAEDGGILGAGSATGPS
jgi:hypothetical protein